MRILLLAAVIVIGLRAAAGRERAGGASAASGADANNAFAIKLYQRVGGGEGNVFFSPASLSVALAMTDLGARGQTRKQMETVLEFAEAGDPAKVQDAYAALYDRMGEIGAGGDAQLKMASRLWPQKRYAFLPQFVTEAKRYYEAAPEPLDYSADPEGARRAINKWVEAQTGDKIRELIKPGVLPADTRLVLTNAIYFKGAWSDPFAKAATKDEPFHLTAEKQADVAMMHRTGEYKYGEDDAAQWLELPYAKGDVAMMVLLPRKVDGLGELAKSLDAKSLARRVGAMAHREGVRVSLPRFRMTGAFELSSVLSAMGMPLAFDEHKADFSGMTTQEALMISKVIHQAYVDVNEEGTEAAAASAIAMKPRAARLPAAPTEFKADHPFLLLIRDTRTGAILFMGRVAEPKGA
jgi:serpin B